MLTALLDGVKLVLTAVALLVGGLVILGAGAWAVLSTSDASREQAYYECVARIMEHQIPQDRKSQFMDVCMLGQAYRRTGGICGQVRDLEPGAYCYVPKWVFWVS